MNITDIISILMAVPGFVLAFYVYLRDKRDCERKLLAQNVIAFYALEEEAIALLNEKTHGKYRDKRKAKTLLRDRAEKNEHNPYAFHPSLSAKMVKRYL